MGLLDRLRDLLPGSGQRVIGYVPAAPIVETYQDRALQAPLASQGRDLGRAASGLAHGQEGPRKGSHEILKMYRESPWLRSVSHLVASGVGAVQWHLYAAPDVEAKGRFAYARRDFIQAEPLVRHRMNRKAMADGELVEIQRHPWCWLMDHPNILMRGKVARQTTVASYDMIGDSAWVLGRSQDDVVRRAWPIPGTWITCRPTEDNPTYTITIGGGGSAGASNGVQWAVPWRDLLLFTDPDPSNPYGRGTGLGLSLADEIDIDEHAARTVNAWFQNKALPDAIVTLKGAPKPVIERAKRDWNNLVQGFAKSWKTHFTNTEIDVKRLDTTFKDQALVEIRRAQRDTIQQVWRVPPEKMGILTNSNRATSLSADYIDAKDVKVPRLETMRDEFQRLAEMYDPRLICDYDNPVPADAETRKAVMVAMPWYFSINEHRELAECDPLPGIQGDGHIVEQEGVKVWVANLTEAKPLIRADHISAGIPTRNEVRQRLRLDHTTDEDGDEPTGHAPPPGGGFGQIPPAPVDPDAETETDDPAAGDEGTPPGPPDPPPPPEAPAAGSAAATTMTNRAPKPMATMTGEELRTVVRAASSRPLIEMMTPVVVHLIREYGQGTLDDLPTDALPAGSFKTDSPAVRARLREFAVERIQARINVTTRDALEHALRDAVVEHHHRAWRESLPAGARLALAVATEPADGSLSSAMERADGTLSMTALGESLRAAIAAVFAQARDTRAEQIAKSEVTGHSQFAAVEALRQTGIVQEKEWLATLDGRARDSHEALDGQRQQLDVPFEIPAGQLDAGAKADAPGAFNIPRQDINCRCAVGTVISGLDDERVAALHARGVLVNVGADPEARALAWRKMDEALQPWDKRMAAAVREAFDVQELAVLAALDDALET